MKKISICIPVLNEEENILNAYNKVIKVFDDKIKNYDYEIIFTDNHSKDGTENILQDLCKKNQKVKYIRFKNNLDYDKSILEAYKHSTGDVAVVIDCDLQDPPDFIVNFIKKWEEGYDVVYGVVKSRKENPIVNFLRKIFYLMMNLNAQFNYPLNANDFRLVDRKLINCFKDNNNLFPYVRGLTFSLAPKPIGIPDALNSITAPHDEPAFLTAKRYFSHNLTDFLSGQKKGFFLISESLQFCLSQDIKPN